MEIAFVLGCWVGRLCRVEKRKGEGLAQVLSVVLPPRCHHPRLDCLFQRHLRLIDRHMGAGSSFLVFWEAFLSVWCSVFLARVFVECEE